MRLRFMASEQYGGGNVRSHWPAAALAERHPDWIIRSETWWPKGDEYDLFIHHRPLAGDTMQRIRRVREDGSLVIADEDDDLTRVFETKNEIGKALWTPRLQRHHDDAIEASDALIVSTPRLAEVYGPLNPNVIVVENYLPSWISRIRFYRPPEGHGWLPRVGWMGLVKTHLHDLEWIRPVAREMLAGAVFSTVGDGHTPEAMGVNGTVMETFGPQADPTALYRIMARADIGIVPLAPIEFNVAKSWLKALEYMLLGKPVVATRLPEQERLIRHGVDGFLAEDPDEFAGYVRRLVADVELRETMAAAARERARAFTIEANVDRWEEAIDRVTSSEAVRVG